MKEIISILLLFQSSIAFSQSKKEQIDILNMKLDTLTISMDGERKINFEKLQTINTKIQDLQNQILLLNFELKKTNENINQKELENTQLKTDLLNKSKAINDLNLQLNNKSDSLIITKELIKLNKSSQINVMNDANDKNEIILQIGKDQAYDFDRIKPTLKTETNTESEKIKLWILQNITLNHPSSLYTKECHKFISDIPFELELSNTENPDSIIKNFKQKWDNQFDMNRIIFSPFEPGNGGCLKIQVTNLKFIGSLADKFYYTLSLYCNSDKIDTNNLIIVILSINGKYLIANVMNQQMKDYFSGY